MTPAPSGGAAGGSGGKTPTDRMQNIRMNADERAAHDTRVLLEEARKDISRLTLQVAQLSTLEHISLKITESMDHLNRSVVDLQPIVRKSLEALPAAVLFVTVAALERPAPTLSYVVTPWRYSAEYDDAYLPPHIEDVPVVEHDDYNPDDNDYTIAPAYSRLTAED